MAIMIKWNSISCSIYISIAVSSITVFFHCFLVTVMFLFYVVIIDTSNFSIVLVFCFVLCVLYYYLAFFEGPLAQAISFGLFYLQIHLFLQSVRISGHTKVIISSFTQLIRRLTNQENVQTCWRQSGRFSEGRENYIFDLKKKSHTFSLVCLV